jgi:protein-S-isoprenylcysteine O-methyltransferase Ste14
MGSLKAARDVELEHPDRLVTTGTYAANPMYVGWALLHVGGGVTGGRSWIVATFPAVAAWMHRTVLRKERRLTDDFGEEFRRYRRAAPR